MSDNNDSSLIKTLKDWRVALMLLLVVFSVVSIYVIPPGISNGMTGNLQLGLDLEGGSWIQLSFESEVVRFETDEDPEIFAARIGESLDAEVFLFEEDRLEIRAPFTREELEPVFSENGGGLSRRTGRATSST